MPSGSTSNKSERSATPASRPWWRRHSTARRAFGHPAGRRSVWLRKARFNFLRPLLSPLSDLIGSRHAADVRTYPDVDLHSAGGYTHKDGTPYP